MSTVKTRVIAKRDVLLTLLVAVFFLSGFSALLYQVIWQRMLGLFSGSDVRSVAIIVAAYLAGLGLGNFIGSLAADRLESQQAVRLYGLCNFGIAGFAVLSKVLFYDVLYRQLSFVQLPTAMILIVVFVSLLIPTTLMGLSLPLLSRALVQKVEQAPGVIGSLYGVNTLGSGLGCFLTGWFIAGTFGYEFSIYVGAAMNVLVGITALLIAHRFQTIGVIVKRSRNTPTGRISSQVLMWAALVFISGFIAISLEMIWFRVLIVTLKSNAYTYGHFLTFILLGNGFGTLLGVRAVKSSRKPRRVFLTVVALVVIYTIASILFLALLSSHSGWLQLYLQHTAGYLSISDLSLANVVMSAVTMLLIPALVLLPPNILLGYYFPFVQKGIQTDSQTVGQRVGVVGVANILGNTLGSLLVGLLALQFLGTRGTLIIIAVLGLILVVLLWRDNGSGRRWIAGLGVSLAVLVILIPEPKILWSQLQGASTDDTVITAEDASGVSVLQSGEGAARLYVDGIVQGEIPFLPVHSFLGAIPSLIHPHPEEILVIGVGSGGTPYSVGVNPEVKHILAVEIVGSEISALQEYLESHTNSPLRPLLEDPRVEFRVGDGRREMVLSQHKFDIIEADAIYPWRSHAGMLYSREFFEEARSQLAEGGIMAQWAPTARIETTFLSVFPYVVDIGNNILIGSDSPLEYDSEQLLARLNEMQTSRYLGAASVDIDAMRNIIANHQPRFWTPENPRLYADLNSDLFPRDEYYLNLPVFK